jgi:hypothetical protein
MSKSEEGLATGSTGTGSLGGSSSSWQSGWLSTAGSLKAALISSSVGTFELEASAGNVFPFLVPLPLPNLCFLVLL